jgi:hypothetical protein
MTTTAPLPCGHRTRHTTRVGCCAHCAVLFSSDSAFTAHIKSGIHLLPADVGLIARPSKTAPGETVWALPGGYYDEEQQ